MIKFIFLETYGCSANQNNSEIIKGLIRQCGLELTSNPKIADLIIINSCVVKEPTEKKIENRIKEFIKLKKKIIIAGCMPEIRKEKLREKNIFLLGNNHLKDLPKLLRKISENNYKEKEFLSEKREIKLCLSKIFQNKNIGITQISEGCLGDCNYCLTKFAKGKLFSYPEEEILKNIHRDLKLGVKEIWITSQDNASYGLPEKRKLPDLLKKILALKGKFKLRLGMSNPNNIFPILDEIIEIFKDEKMYKFLHIPLQSGSNKVLKDMNRFYTKEDFCKIVSEFRKEIPEILIETDVIVAYPFETESDFEETFEIIKKIKPQFLNISKYWAMKGTKAAQLEQLPSEVAKKRAVKIINLHKKIVEEKNKKEIGKEIIVLINSGKSGVYEARTSNYNLVKIYSKEKLSGFEKIKIVDCQGYSLIGKKV